MDKNNEVEYSTLLVELDALLDTRIAICAQYGTDILEKVLKDNYLERSIDEFKDIDTKEFSEKYAGRDKTTLLTAMVTPIIDMIHEFCYRTTKNSITSPHELKPKILINVHPYDLTEDEINAILTAVSTRIIKLAEVSAINKSYEQITPFYVKNTLSVMILYDYQRWLETHAANEKFKKITCPEVTLFAPRLYFKPVENNDISPDEAFTAMEFLSQPLIGLQLLPIRDFSLKISDKYLS